MSEIRLAGLSDHSAISSFINQHWKKDHAYVKSKKLFDWTFQANPNWNEVGYSISVAIEGNSIQGMLGTIPFDLNVYGKSFKACWLVNWLLLPEARKGRLGINLLNLFSKDYGYDTISFGINDTVARLYTALKWQDMPIMPRMVWINPNDTLSTKALLMEANPNENVLEIIRYINTHAKYLDQTTHSLLNPREIIKTDSWNINGWENWKFKTVGCSRDSKYLLWRYFENPIYKYESRMIADGKNIGLIIWRVENTKRRNSNGQIEDLLPIARIVEFLPASKANAVDLLSEFSRHANEVGIKAADFYCYNEEICEILVEIGLVVSRNHVGVNLPNHTQPIATGGAIRSAIKIADDHRVNASARHWYWTKSDSDQDRPN